MAIGAVLEPLVVIVLLLGGTWINRLTDNVVSRPRRKSAEYVRPVSPDSDSLESGYSSPTPRDSLLDSRPDDPPPETSDNRWRSRLVGCWSLSCKVASPNTAVFQDRLLSRVIRKLPFVVECWYWALVYWVSFLLTLSFPLITTSSGRHLSPQYERSSSI